MGVLVGCGARPALWLLAGCECPLLGIMTGGECALSFVGEGDGVTIE